MKKYKGKRLSALLLSGAIALSSAGCARPIVGYKHSDTSAQIQEYKKEETLETTQDIRLDNQKDDLIIMDYDEFRKKLEEQFATSNVTLDEESDKFVSSIYVDGTMVKVVLTDGSTVEGKLQHLELGGLNLENFYVLDTQFQKDFHNKTYGDYSELLKAYSSHDKIHIEISYINEISIHNEFKFSKNSGNDVESMSGWEDSIDISKCQNLWLDNVNIFSRTLQKINEASSLKKLILTSVDLIGEDMENMILTLPNLKTFICDMFFTNELYSIDLSECVNLERISFGNNTQIESLDFLSELDKLKVVSFGNLSTMDSMDSLRSFEYEENLLLETFQTDDSRLAKGHNNLIHDISGINGKNIEVLNISLLNHVSSEQLYQTVISLPNLQKIVGFEINNAEMCSEELLQYCEQHGISHPFTEKSMAIKKELQRIVAELVTPDMDDFQKVEVLSAYIMSKLEYDNEAADTEDKSSELHKRAWGENLYYTTMEGIGLCAGYEEFAVALFTEAGIKCYKQSTFSHAYNLVEINGIYYQIDLTNLDYLLEVLYIPIEEYNFEINSRYYMIPVEDQESLHTFSEPYGATIQRESKNETKPSQSEYDVYSDNTGNVESSLIENSTSSTNGYKLISILVANGIAKKVSDHEVEKLHEMSMSTSNIQSPFWSTGDYEEFYTRYIAQNLAIRDERTEYDEIR